MQIKDIEKLKDWLLKKLEPLCDADPAALAKYVVALLRKDKPKAALKDLCIDQLEVFLAKETSGFVEQLFRSLDNESYLKGVDPPSSTKSVPAESAKHTQTNDTKTPSSSTAPPPVSDRRQSEDHGRRNEVDDEDRDFRRSRRGGGSGGRGNNDSAPVRRVVTTATSSTSDGGSSVGIGRKRRMETVQDSQGTTRRRVMNDHGMVDSVGGQPSSNNVTSSSSGGQGGGNTTGRRPVKERLGVRADDRSDSRSRRYRRGHSSSPSSSSSGSGSDSSSDSDRRSRGRKRKRYSKTRSSSTEGRRRQRCQDYDEKGFCILGESCPYDHGVDPLVIGGNEINPYPPPPPLGLPPPGMPLPPNARKTDLMIPPVIPNMPGSLPRPRGILKVTDGYNPEDPALSSSKSSEFIPVPMVPRLGPPLHPPMAGAAIPPPLSMAPIPHRHIPFSTPSSMNRPPPPFPPPFRHPRPPFGGRPLGPSRQSDTLIIRKIPRELNSITKLSSHFEKFGNIVNLKVRYEGDVEGALVQFSTPSEATKAHNSAEAVLNNRFIKVYYLRLNDTARPPLLKEVSLETPVSLVVSSICGPTSEPSTATRDSTTVVSSSVQSTNSIAPHPTPDSSSVATGTSTNTLKMQQPIANEHKTSPPHKATPPPLVPHPPINRRQQRRTTEMTKEYLELQKKTQELLHKQIQQQKLLIAKLEKTGKQLPAEEKSKILKTLQTLSTNITKLKEAATVTKKRADSAKELTRPSPQQPPAANSLKQKADALRKEAHQLGLIKSPSQPLPTGGKGHGRPPKPRMLLVIGVQDRDQLTSYFESFGALEQVETDPNNTDNLIFSFRNAYSANKAVKSSSVFNGKPLIMKWYTGKPRQTPATPTLPTVSVNPMLPHKQDSNVVSSESNQMPLNQTVMKQVSIDDQVTPITTPTLVKPDPVELHLVEDSDDDDKDNEGRSWKR